MYTFHPAVAGTVAQQLVDERIRETSRRSAARAIRQSRRSRAHLTSPRRRAWSLTVLRRSFG